MSDTMQQVVDDGVVIFEEIETKIPQLQMTVTSLKSIIDRGAALNMGNTARAISLKARIDAIYGKLSSVYADTLDLHNQCTITAKANGVDIMEPNGGTSRTVY